MPTSLWWLGLYSGYVIGRISEVTHVQPS